MTKTKQPEKPDPFEWLEDPDAWDWVEDIATGHNALANTLSAVIAAIEAGESQRVATALRAGLHLCFLYTEECDMAAKLWAIQLIEGARFEDELKIVLRRLLGGRLS